MDTREYYIKEGNLSYEVDEEHTDEELTKAEMELLSTHLSGIRNAVHLCCGAGRHVSAFGNLGIFSVGVDISPYLLAAGRLNIMGLNVSNSSCLVLGDASTTPIISQGADCVTLLGNSFTLFTENEVRNVLTEIRRILRSGGIFIFDIPDKKYVEANLLQGNEISRFIKTKSLGEVNWTWKRQLNKKKCTLTSRETLTFTDENERPRVKKITFVCNLYDPQKTSSMASKSGLKPIKRIEYHDTSGRYKGMMVRRIFLIMKAQD